MRMINKQEGNPEKLYTVQCPKCHEITIKNVLIDPTKVIATIECDNCNFSSHGLHFLVPHPIEDNSLRTATMPKNTLTNTTKVTDSERLDMMSELQKRIIGQDHVLDQLTSVFYKWEVGMSQPQAPAGTFLLLGPTGTGKTHTVEAFAEILFGNPKAFIKVDCAEFAHSHEIAKLLGSPPGYLGHRETQPAMTQEALARYYTDKYKCSIVLFDEIEKASDALWNLLLGVLDKATLTLGDNRRVDFSNVFIFMTSNLGAREMQSELEPGFGFHEVEKGKVNQNKLDEIALNAAKKRFQPEFMNRLDAKLVYRTLTRDDLSTILEQLLDALQDRIFASKSTSAFGLNIGDDVRELLLAKGVSRAYGARELKRSIEQNLTVPLVRLIRSGDFKTADIVRVSAKDGKCVFKAGKSV